jgi:hypothetical protein
LVIIRGFLRGGQQDNKNGRPQPPCSLGHQDLENLDVLGLPALLALYHAKLDLLAFLQAAKTARLDSREVHKHIFAVLPADEPVTLGIVEPLNRTLFHGVAFLSYFEFALNQESTKGR